MIVLLRDLDDVEYRVGVAAGSFVDPESARGEVQDFRSLVALGGLADSHAHLSGDDVADMVLFRQNPIDDPTELERPALVMRAGRTIVDLSA